MTRTTISSGTVHKMSADLEKGLRQSKKALELWEDITQLARNEFICWVEDTNNPETRARRIKRTREELLEGNRRPCCWVGCIHRTDKAMNSTQKWIVAGKPKS